MECGEYRPAGDMRCTCGAMAWEHQQFKRQTSFWGDRTKRPVIRRPDYHHMIDQLRGRGWTTAKILEPLTGLNERALREVAHVSDGQILSGQKGYKLTVEATEDEVREATGWLVSQSEKMARRAIAIQRVWVQT
jgi:hypothetical protein